MTLDYLMECIDEWWKPVLLFFLCTSFVYVGYRSIRFYLLIRHYPPGPFPVPFFGNVPALLFHGALFKAAAVWSIKYGDPFTFWMGEKPLVIVNTPEYIQEANSFSNRMLLCGRIQSETGIVQMRGNIGVIFSDFSEGWKAMRSVAQVALKKFSQSRISASLAAHVIKEANVKVAPEKIECKHFAEHLVQSFVSASAFGQDRCDKQSRAERQELQLAHRKLEENCPSGLPSDTLPILRYVCWQKQRNGMKAFNQFANIVTQNYTAALSRHNSDCVAHFTDAVLSVRNEMLQSGKLHAKYLTDNNMSQIVFDMFEAASQTTVCAMTWMILVLADDQALQERLYTTITNVLGADKRPATEQDKPHLACVQSFIRESLRMYPPVPLGLPRRCTADFVIGGRRIPKDSGILFNILNVNRDPKQWSNPDVFDADRFLQNGQLCEKNTRGFLTFGIIGRSCIGEQVVYSNIFYLITRILQHFKITLPPETAKANLELHGSALMLEAVLQDVVFHPR